MKGFKRATFSCRQVKEDQVSVQVDLDKTIWLRFSNYRGYQGEIILSPEDSKAFLEAIKQVEVEEVENNGTNI